MASSWFKVDSSQLRQRLEHLVAAHPQVATQLTQEVAEAVATRARSLVHVRTGATRDSIRVERINAQTAEVKASGMGAVTLEYGSRYHPPYPFLKPASDQTKPWAFQHCKELLRALYRESH